MTPTYIHIMVTAVLRGPPKSIEACMIICCKKHTVFELYDMMLEWRVHARVTIPTDDPIPFRRVSSVFHHPHESFWVAE